MGSEGKNPALKDTLFDAKRFRVVADEIVRIDSRFEPRKFLALALRDLDSLSLMQRLRHMTECLHATLPDAGKRNGYRATLSLLRGLAPQLERGFATLVLPDYVGQYGHATAADFDVSMDALKYFTSFGSSEFAVREFLRRDQSRALAIMETWSRDSDEHARRLASEGCRPRLPWSFRLDSLVADPSPVAPILENIKADPSLYVRKSVGNHLNDITKDNPDWVFGRIRHWPLDDENTAWIVKRALRTLIKRGDRRALAVIGAGEAPKIDVVEFEIRPALVRLGQRLELSLTLKSTSKQAQRLVVDYVIHYVKKSGIASPKVFKWKELTLPSQGEITINRNQRMQDFSTRKHHPGRHEVMVQVNGQLLAQSHFMLKR